MFEGATVLIIDDDLDVLRGTKLRLTAAGFRTQTAADGTSGFAAATQFPPDAIVLDMRMPDVDGLEVLDMLQSQQETRRIPVIMVSASLSAEKPALERGARFFLTKPYRGSELLQAVNKAIEETQSSTAGGASGLVASIVDERPPTMASLEVRRER